MENVTTRRTLTVAAAGGFSREERRVGVSVTLASRDATRSASHDSVDEASAGLHECFKMPPGSKVMTGCRTKSTIQENSNNLFSNFFQQKVVK
jgi:hypothetical protein